MTILEAGSALRSRQISSLELTNRCLDHIAKLNPRLNAFLTVTGETARSTAQDLDRELAPVAGIAARCTASRLPTRI